MKRLLEVKDLVVRFYTQHGTIYAVNGVSFAVDEGETLGIVGESGCGKTVSVLSVLGLIRKPPGKIEAGQAIYGGRDLLKLNRDELRKVRGAQIAMVFQDPMTSLNPVLTVGSQLTEAMTLHLGLTHDQARQRAVELLERVEIADAESRLGNYPHQFSGGMRQRVMIAMALSCSPKLLIADEPTTALDVTIQAQILRLVKRLREELGMSIVWISHNLGVIAGLADRVIVMYCGAVVEEAPVKKLYATPQHPYTIALLGSVPRLGRWSERLVNIRGLPPDGLREPSGCPFAPRCDYRIPRCLREIPPLEPAGDQHRVACWWDIRKETPRYDE